MTDERLGRFGHHPDPAIDFCIETEALVGMEIDAGNGFVDDAGQVITLLHVKERLGRAMNFVVGGDLNAIDAKAVLREMESRIGRPVLA